MTDDEIREVLRRRHEAAREKMLDILEGIEQIEEITDYKLVRKGFGDDDRWISRSDDLTQEDVDPGPGPIIRKPTC
jgi:hypothetical protein